MPVLHDTSREPAVGGQAEVSRSGPEDLTVGLLHRLVQRRQGERCLPGRDLDLVGVCRVPETDLGRRAEAQSLAVDGDPPVPVR